MSPISSVFAKYRLRPKKRLGQNFIGDDPLLERLSRIACDASNLPVLEIGSGIGNFSVHLARRVPHLWCVEKDRDLEPALRQALAGIPHTEIIINDILNLDLAALSRKQTFNVVGNLPFYATSRIITRLIEFRSGIDRVHITVQKEVAQRLVAKPGGKDYGRLSCLVQYYTDPVIREFIPRRAFIPQPEVDAAFVTLTMLPQPSITVASERLFFQVVKAIFSQRRKTLLNSLTAGPFNLPRQEIQAVLNALRLPLLIRGETLDLETIGKLADALYQRRNTSE